MIERSPLSVVHENLLKIGAIPLQEYLAVDTPPLQPTWDVSSGLNKYATPQDITKVAPQISSYEPQSSSEQQPGDAGGLSLSDPSACVTPELKPVQEYKPVKRIEECCLEWRAGLVVPSWFCYGSFGCALQVKLTPECQRSYSVEPTYKTYEEAKMACAMLAIDQGVLDFIKHGNGQLQPAPRTLRNQDDPSTSRIRRRFASLDEFAKSLPTYPTEPMSLRRDPRGHNFVINWLGKKMSRAHGRLRADLTPVSESNADGTLFGQALTYIVEPVLEREVDVRNAVCLVAAIQGVEAHIASVAKEVACKVTSEMRRLAGRVLALLDAELEKWPHSKTDFTCPPDLDACGCIFTVTLDTTSELSWSFTVPREYKSGADAKVAAVCLAYEQGVIELVRFRGKKPPPGYKVVLPCDAGSSQYVASKTYFKRRRAELEGTNADAGGKKARFPSRAVDGPLHRRPYPLVPGTRHDGQFTGTSTTPPYHVPYAVPGAVATTPYPPSPAAPHLAPYQAW
ncbi:hypothetical protein GLOTRDRAFT_95286 [Gloeophyllum trabeum ATCC 11539]|uniref:Uncharacterized protein n=1 Tax=Gloeophyllum trabeum (strain ATCC 11539 / FP-39264 / Madison 617) TaxID=670483 RepID=S7Q0N0_GLOTA|nr:uncharacterized protein GLOTRDRAFT_95286 [Gloeophyllum trabeum ATCC 11539]EPQ53313.1 hypothetical protein GLOTRDRAFT_95286 [Gloeophyllum trabeum ATCC 11539]